ncbi:hypothetical protein B0T16DRAFT_363734 [Cercophora newfieldiana]|uniref:DUF7924 domain-containing protein n=1 Tax=Cercophora newfieldiana TaxID=92897 RepID=A0AA40CZY8_9PEZI|nr:hypothetical protein B0T16DRAFT_363734 [Cercophora newfieldiana]
MAPPKELPQAPSEPQAPRPSGAKRSHESETHPEDGEGRPSKRAMPSAPVSESAYDESDADESDPVLHWAREGHWPPHHTERDPNMERVLESSSALSSKRSEPSSASFVTPSDQRPREEKSAQYRDPRYVTLLQTKGSFMNRSDLGITDASKALCRTLLENTQSVPCDTLFRDDIFEATCQKIQDKNEARVIRDISRLIVPSAECLATFGAKHLDILTESVNEGWNNSIPLTSTRPQPDYSVGFTREAFTSDQLAKLSPFIGEFLFGDQSFFMATYYMYFPFLTCEVICGAEGLEIADRQNAHSMTLAVRAIVELFRLVKREDEVHRQILAFSVSHDRSSVLIYGHYPVITGKDTKYYRHPIHAFSFTTLDGKEKWTAYRFTKNIYDIWMPAHFKNICSAIDQLPSSLDFDIPPLTETTGHSQDRGSLLSDVDAISLPVEQNSQSSNADRNEQGGTPDTSFTEPQGTRRRKGPKK